MKQTKDSLIEELGDALCDLLHRGDELGEHSPESHLKLYYARCERRNKRAWLKRQRKAGIKV